MMIVAFWISTVLGFGLNLWPKITWMVAVGMIILSGNVMVLSPGAVSMTSAGTALTTIFGPWQLLPVVLIGYAFGWVIGYGAKIVFGGKEN